VAVDPTVGINHPRSPGLPMRRTLSLLLALQVVCSTTSIAQAIELPSSKEAWVEVQTKHFLLVGNAPKNILMDLGREMERCGAALAYLIPVAEDVATDRTTVYVFKDKRLFARYVPSADPRRPTAGLFVRSRHGNDVAVDADPSRDAFGIVYHEYTHFHMASLALHPDLPAWLNEGLAEYFSTFQSQDAVVEVGHPIPNHTYWLREHALIPLDQLFAIDQQSPAYNEGERRGTFYAQSWILVHYLMSQQDGSKSLVRLQQLMEMLETGSTAEDAMAATFTADPKKLLERLQDHAYSEELLFLRIRFHDLKVDETVSSRQLEHIEVLCRLGDFLQHRGGETIAAEAHYQAALALRPEHAPALTGLALLRQGERQFQSSTDLFDRAIRADSSRALTRLLAAENLLDQAQKPGRRTTKNLVSEDIRQAQTLLLGALRLDPDLPGAPAQLAYTFLFGDQDPAPAIAALERSPATLRSDPNSAYNLLILHLRRGDRAAAQRVFGHYLRGANGGIRDTAREALLRAEMTVVDSLMQADQYEAALAHVQQIASETQDPEFMKVLESRVERMERHHTEQLEVDLYNRAADLANARKYVEAEKLLVGLADGAVQPDLRQSARKLLADVRRALGTRAK